MDKIMNKIIELTPIKKRSMCITGCLIEMFNTNPNIMKNSLIHIKKILQCIPPKKNENKFTYGKLIEGCIINAINQIDNIECDDLDKKYDCGSEYKYDCHIKLTKENLDKKFSIKASKSGGKVTIINKRNRQDHELSDLSFIICHIKNKKLYIFMMKDIPLDYIQDDGAGIHFRSSIFTYLNKDSKYYYEFPKLEDEIEENLLKITELDHLLVLNEMIKNIKV